MFSALVPVSQLRRRSLLVVAHLEGSHALSELVRFVLHRLDFDRLRSAEGVGFAAAHIDGTAGRLLAVNGARSQVELPPLGGHLTLWRRVIAGRRVVTRRVAGRVKPTRIECPRGLKRIVVPPATAAFARSVARHEVRTAHKLALLASPAAVASAKAVASAATPVAATIATAAIAAIAAAKAAAAIAAASIAAKAAASITAPFAAKAAAIPAKTVATPVAAAIPAKSAAFATAVAAFSPLFRDFRLHIQPPRIETRRSLITFTPATVAAAVTAAVAAAVAVAVAATAAIAVAATAAIAAAVAVASAISAVAAAIAGAVER